MTNTNDRKTGSELSIGDVIVYGEDCHTITGIRPHSEKERRVIQSGDWEMTVFDSDSYRRMSDGTWIASHLWFSRNKR